MMVQDWLQVPVGAEAGRWVTRTAEREVLAIVHNVTSLTRLLDVVALLDSDSRLQTVFTWTRSSPFTQDVEHFLDELGAIHIPWEQAISSTFDLAISASYGGDLHLVKAPLVTVSHGAGYNKKLVKSQESRVKSRDAGAEGPFGLSAEWLLHEGRLVPSTIVLSHPEQVERLAENCPAGVPAAVVAGDPCYDRMLAGIPHRPAYRGEFGVDPDQRMVVVSSTWGRNSLFGRHPDLIEALLAELPVDEYRVVAALHPNVWHGHGPWQVRSWLTRAVRAGLVLLPPRDGWRAALVAADLVIGDHGSVTFYGAALGHPTLLATFPHDDLDPRSPVARLGRTLPHLRHELPFRPQIESAMKSHDPAAYSSVTEQITSAPGQAGQLLRSELYRILKLDEPAAPPMVTRVPMPTLDSAKSVTALLVNIDWPETQESTAQISRLPAHVTLHDETNGWFLSVDDAEPEERLLNLADVIHSSHHSPLSAEWWLTQTLASRPGCFTVAAQETPGTCLILSRDGTLLQCETDHADLAAAIAYDWLGSGRPATDLPAQCTVHRGGTEHHMTFKRL